MFFSILISVDVTHFSRKIAYLKPTWACVMFFLNFILRLNLVMQLGLRVKAINMSKWKTRCGTYFKNRFMLSTGVHLPYYYLFLLRSIRSSLCQDLKPGCQVILRLFHTGVSRSVMTGLSVHEPNVKRFNDVGGQYELRLGRLS